MSKLYETLEQIRRHETYQVPGTLSGRDISASGARRWIKTSLLLLTGAAIFAGLILFLLPRIKSAIEPPSARKIQPITSSSPAPAAVKTAPPEPTTVASDEVTRINNQATTLITSGEYWQAIYLLNKTSVISPGRIEPLINLGVAFSELGLYGPANRYFSMAYGLEPANPMLRENLHILKKAGLLEQPLSFYFSSGEKQLAAERKYKQ